MSTTTDARSTWADAEKRRERAERTADTSARAIARELLAGADLASIRTRLELHAEDLDAERAASEAAAAALRAWRPGSNETHNVS